MPSTSSKQHRFMEMVAHNPKMAKKVGVPQSVGKDFVAADKGKKFNKGGMMKENMKADIKQDKAIVKKAFRMHDKQEHKSGPGTDLSKLKKGGMAMKKMAKGGMAKESMGPRSMSKDVEAGSNKLRKFGESAVQKKGHTKGKNLGDSGKTVAPKAVKMAKGGKVKRYDEGGDVDTQTAQGQNANIGDDTRARAMAALASGNMDQQVPTPVVKPRMKAKPKSNVMTKAMGNMNPMGDTYKKGGDVKKMARGGGIEQRGKTRGRFC